MIIDLRYINYIELSSYTQNNILIQLFIYFKFYNTYIFLTIFFLEKICSLIKISFKYCFPILIQRETISDDISGNKYFYWKIIIAVM